MRSTFISSVLVLVSSATATITLSSRSPNPAAALFARQTGIDPTNVDPACQPTCAEIADTLNNCSDLSCLCTTTAAQQISLCADCLVAVAGSEASSTQQSEQVIIDQFTEACAENGQAISSIIVSSVSPTITASGTSGAASQTASGGSTAAAASGSGSLSASGLGSSSSAASQASSVTTPTPTSGASAVGAVGVESVVVVVVGLMVLVQGLLV